MASSRVALPLAPIVNNNTTNHTIDVEDIQSANESDDAAPSTAIPMRLRRREAKAAVPLAIKHAEPDFRPRKFARPFCKFLSNNPTVYHATSAVAEELNSAGYQTLSARQGWKLEKGGKYLLERNGSGLIAFEIGKNYEPGNGVAMIAAHIDALTAKVKPVPKLETKEGFVQLAVAPYGGALNPTWWDRDLGIAGRVLVKEESGKIVTKLVNLDGPIARIPTLAPHFGAPSQPPFNLETQTVPIIALDNSDILGTQPSKETLGRIGSFAATQPAKLVKAVASSLNVQDVNNIINWELELYDCNPATVGGLEKDFIYGGRVDDKLCSWAAVQALLGSTYSGPDGNDTANNDTSPSSDSGIIKLVGLFDDEEIGSLLRQGAQGNFLPLTIERIIDAFAPKASANVLGQTYANSFLISADVCHAVNPNFLGAYMHNHSPRLNIGPVVSWDSNGHMSTDAMSTALLSQVAELCGSRLQVFQIRNDSRSGGTVGPMLSTHMGCRSIDCGIPQLSMHSIRATTGALDPGLGVKLFKGFFDHFESVDKAFRQDDKA